MKITVNESITKEIELPLYFRSKRYSQDYFMTVGNNAAIKVTDHEITESLVLFPKIEVIALDSYSGHYFTEGITPLSETEFKLVFTQVTNRIESLLN